ncbi:MAG: hypothetical protein BWY89_01646 [Bacteroidetes bacterium ADurb.BinA012]|nr:MAG: hypothetical protein BWY89_01646 [Bacteroidetes bacterium ADurb.BinA012]
MVRAALAEPDGIKRLITVWVMYIMLTDAIFPAPEIDSESLYSRVSMMLPFWRIMMIPPARPTISAAD